MKETPSQLPIQSYLLNFPFTLSTDDPNNIWMKEMTNDELKLNKSKAYRQFMDLYNFMAGQSLVYLLPSEGNFQDLVYVANLGIQLPHIKDDNIILLSNFTSPPRQGEELVGQKFFNQMGYKTFISPYKWEGEADLKYIGGNNYIGGYGIRSNIESYDWMEEKFDMNIIKVEMVDEYLYHLDCTIFPLNRDKTLVCTSLYDPDEIVDIERYTDVIDVSEDDAMYGLTNSVRLGNMVLTASHISELKKGTDDYNGEKHKIESLEKICGDHGMELAVFNLSEYIKSGALLSCLVFHLGKVDYNKILI